MEFIRRNLFYVALVLIVVVLLAAMMLLKSGADSDARKYLAEKQAVMNSLSSLARQDISPEKVERQKQRNQAVIEAAEAVSERLVERNRGNYEVFRLKAGEKDLPAFPVDEELYNLHALRFEFPRVYQQKIRQQIQLLHPASVWTEQEEQEAVEQRLRVLQVIEKAKQPNPEGGAAEPMGPRGPEGPMDMDWMAPARARRGAAGASSDLTVQARSEALAQLKQKYSRTGLMYVAPVLFSTPAFDETLLAAPGNRQLWEAQVRYWVFSDIVAAINATNEQVVQLPGRTRSVTDSAIKHLLQVNVGGYFLPPAYGSASDSAATLTGRACNTLYDVQHYDFTVRMPTRYLPLLQQQLLRRNLHTILDVRIAPPGDAPGQTAARREDASRDQERYYYGAEPVSQVRISGELLLLTKWERGHWGAQANDWSPEFPPLMPVEVLVDFQSKAARVLRPEDQTAIAEYNKNNRLRR